MDSKEIDTAMKHRLPVICNGRRFDYIKEYISWYDDAGKRRLSCGLIVNNCIERVPADKVELAGSNT